MCGILYCRQLDGKSANQNIKKIYFDQRERGTNGYGFVAIKDGLLKHHRSKYEHLILHDLKENQCPEILFHHRKPTSTINIENANHPLCSENNFKNHKYYMVHNGSIYNSSELYRKHTDIGMTYNSIVGVGEYDKPIFNDSECLLLELALVIEGKKRIKDFNACGSMAFIMIQTDNDGKPLNMYFGRNEGSPLKIKQEKGQLIIASSIDDAEDVATNKLNKISYETNESSVEDMIFPRSYIRDDYSYGRGNESPIELPGHRLELETPFQRENLMNITQNLGNVNDLDDDEEDLTKKKDEELYLLQEGLMGDLDTTVNLMHSEHDKKELARLRSEENEIKQALNRVDSEIDKRIKANDKIPRT